MNAIVFANACRDPREVGGKGWSLALAQRAGLPVPPWFAVPAAATDAELPSMAALAAAMQAVAGEGGLFAVRSSAVDEDGAKHSFAGQLQSFLFVPADQVATRIAEVRRSAIADRALAYRRHRGLAAPAGAAVLVQRMVRADSAGVAFSADPVSGRRGITVVAGTRGVGEALVSGARDADTWHLNRHGEVESAALAGKQPCLDLGRVRRVAALARRCQHCFGVPQDIEWAYEGDELFLLQSRPITSIAALADPDGAIALWDSSNIAESYAGVTTPLTFSFIRRNYEFVYRELARIGGVGEEVIEAHDDALRCMLGLRQGRVYYNLLSWYRLVALVPGFAHNRRFLDGMLGVGEEASRTVLQGIVEDAHRASVHPLAGAARQAVRIGACFAGVARRNARFRARLEAALAPPAIAFADQRPEELAAEFRAIDRRLLRHWDAPLVNDYFAMIFHGLLGRLVERWCGASAAGLANDLLAGRCDIVSMEPARRMRAMALEASRDPAFARMLRDGSLEEIVAALPRLPAFEALYRQYLARFGSRCFEELKLESRPLDEEPLPLLRAIGHLAANLERTAARHDSTAAARDAEQRAAAALAVHPIRRALFQWVLAHARARVRDRENLRFERTRLYGRVRQIFCEIGKRLHAAGRLDAPRDVFYLELDEVLRYVEGTATTVDLKGLAALRKAEFDRHRAGEAPPDRFETRGIAFERFECAPPSSQLRVSADCEEARATGCCPGVVRGVARIVRHPESARLQPGDILVAERTDPGWVMLFAAASGLVIERGSLLSHAAIVSREMGIPAVIGLRGACRWLEDGDRIEVDGASGVVRRLERASLRSAA